MDLLKGRSNIDSNFESDNNEESKAGDKTYTP